MPDSAVPEPSVRISISKKTRFEIFKRDRFTCQYCGAHPPNTALEVDHIVAVSLGGSSERDNLVTACLECNRGKAARDLRVIPESLIDKAERIKESEAQLRGYQKILKAKRDRLESEKWQIVSVIWPSADSCRRDYLRSIVVFLERLGFDAVFEAAEIASAARIWNDNRRFRYFCGCCWKRIDEAQR